MFTSGSVRLGLLLLGVLLLSGVAKAVDIIPWPANRTAVTVDRANRNAERIRKYQNARNSRINTVNRY